MEKEYKYLGRVNSPEDVKRLNKSEAEELCAELREHIIAVTEKNGGHLASNLGAIELTVAIHRVFDCPRDHVIFDVGHQSYAHKILTGRFDKFDTLRQPGGITGFTNRAESEYDCFGAGHSSTSLSAALGFAKADRLSGNDAYTVAVLGDGAFTGGMIHEALNNCDKNLNLIIILNENEMSISKNIGSFASSLAKLRRKSGYYKAKRRTVSFVKKIPFIGKGLFNLIKNVKKSIKNSLYGSNYFEDMGLYYIGPADGNNYEDVEALLTAAKNAGESVLVHLKTKKGKGYAPAETDPNKYHGLRPSSSVTPTGFDFSSEFGKAICSLAESDDKICAITAAMSSGTGLDGFAEKYPKRFFDVGIAEEHAVTFAAGLAANGYKPVFAVYSSFLQRGYDQMIHDVALQKLPVVFCVDRAGFNNADGATHHGIFDVAFASHTNGMKIYSPVTYKGLYASLKTAISDEYPSIIRYPSGSENELVTKHFYKGEYDGKISPRSDFSSENMPDNIIITHGRIAAECIKAKKLLEESGESVGIVLCEYVAPYEKLSDEIAAIFRSKLPKKLIFVEEEIKIGGFGMTLFEHLKNKINYEKVRSDILAAKDAFVERRAGESYLEASGLNAKAIADRIRSL